jgi:hypothetical protein
MGKEKRKREKKKGKEKGSRKTKENSVHPFDPSKTIFCEKIGKMV